MPTYDYECAACGHVFETMHAMSAPALRKCPKCGKNKLQRLISGGAGVIFKGSGFYETDYRRAGTNGNGNGKAESEPAKTETKTETAAPAASESAPAPAANGKSAGKGGAKKEGK